ncbi:diguanylate cyclase [Lysobacter sp. yr284]|uniref:diguanylate cyclase n=1 Tax=Lysobacter sp. yr284 TaxID=1761791 RepID=UPI00089D643E|nr:diguanylate cyclase [Lysobacter sp. yr284]SDY23715.1 diguanylate cyclase [Lysobacter sp. yr284]
MTATDPSAYESGRASEHLRFVGRIYRMRSLGLGVGFFAVAGVLYEHGAAWWAWAALFGNGFLWPSAAYLIASRSRDPEYAEYRNLLIDSAVGGVWIAAMQFNVVPSALLAVMLSADKIGVGGWRFLLRTAAVQALACAVAWAALGFGFAPDSSMMVILACLPFMFVYPMAISSAAYGLARKVVRQNRQLAHLSRTDPLTGLQNRLHWDDSASATMTHCARSGKRAALVLIDVDRFKEINDYHGHQVGDAVLRRIADVLHRTARMTDTASRIGGDEFALIVMDIDGAGACAIAERLRCAVADARFDEAPELRCTVSIGVAATGARTVTAAMWMRHADAALYRAKQSGRNAVEVAPE